MGPDTTCEHSMARLPTSLSHQPQPDTSEPDTSWPDTAPAPASASLVMTVCVALALMLHGRQSVLTTHELANAQ